QPLALAAPPPPPPLPPPPPPPHADRAASAASRSRRFNSLLIPPRIHPVIATPWLRIAESQSQLTRSGHGPHHRTGHRQSHPGERRCSGCLWARERAKPRGTGALFPRALEEPGADRSARHRRAYARRPGAERGSAPALSRALHPRRDLRGAAGGHGG